MGSLRHLRRLFYSDPINETFSGICQPFCDPLLNHSGGFCLSPCLQLCPRFCRYPYIPSLPAPLPTTLPQPLRRPPPPPPPPHHESSFVEFVNSHQAVFNTLFYVLAGLAVLALCYMWYDMCCSDSSDSDIIDRFLNWSRALGRRPQEPERNVVLDEFLFHYPRPVLHHPIWHIRTVGLRPSAISAITVCKYKKGEGLIEGTECSVCLSEFEEDETLRLLPKCSHAFHVPCIDTWLLSHANCPMCRAPVVTNVAQALQPEQPYAESSAAAAGIGAQEIEDSMGREPERAVESRRESEEDGELDLEDGRNRIEDSINEVQPMRRSNALRGESGSIRKSCPELAEENLGISGAIVHRRNASQEKLPMRMMGSSSSSIDSSQASGSSSKTRSVSSSRRFLFSKKGRSKSLVLPL